jgi:hypothetical protein
MPNRYEREIEEILRNLEHSDSEGPAPNNAGWSRPPKRERPPRRPYRGGPAWNLAPGEWLLLIAVLAALIGGGYAYARPWHEGDIFSGILALVGAICLLLVALTNFIAHRPKRSQSVQFGNVTITPLRRGPFSWLRTRWNLFLLKLNYRKNSRRR